MKTINDFIIEDEIAKLNGVSYSEEAKVVDEFLRMNPNIKYVSVKSKDGRSFKLNNERLQITNEDTFINPYYQDVKVLNSISTIEESINLEAKVSILEEKIIKLEKFFKGLMALLDGYNK